MSKKLPPQLLIEQKMQQITMNGSYDMVHLFSSEGLPLAEHYKDDIIEKDRLTELALLLKQVQEMADVMGQISNIKEMIIEGFNHRKIIFRFFYAFGQEVVLAVVVPPNKSYRAYTNALVRTITKINF